MRNKKNIFIFVVTILLVFGVVGLSYFFNQKNGLTKNPVTENAIVTNREDVSASTEDIKGTTKEDSTPQTNNFVQPTEPSKETTSVSESLQVFSNATLTVYLNQEDSLGIDGKTQIPKSAIIPYFYMPYGNYTVQKLENGTWKDLLTNVSYPGHGGLWAFYAGPSEDNVSYKVLKIENGKPVSVSKTFVVKRSDLEGGFKTYN